MDCLCLSCYRNNGVCRMIFGEFHNLEPEAKYQAYRQMLASVETQGGCKFWTGHDMDVAMARRIMYYFASGDDKTQVLPTCQNSGCIDPHHCYPTALVAERKGCWDYIRKFSAPHDDCMLWVGDSKTVPWYQTDIYRLTVAQAVYELYYGVKFHTYGRFQRTCGLKECIDPRHLQPLNPTCIFHWSQLSESSMAEGVMSIIKRLPVEQSSGCRIWLGSVNARSHPKLRVGNKRFSLHKLIYNHGYGQHEPQQKTSMTCGNSICVEPSHIVAYPPQTPT